MLALKARASTNHRSEEAEAREILRIALRTDPAPHDSPTLRARRKRKGRKNSD